MPEQQRRFTLALSRKLGVRASLEVEVVPDWLRRPGRLELGSRWSFVQTVYEDLTGLALPEEMPPRERRRLDVVITYRDGARQVVEFDERQHFTSSRLTTLRHYEDVDVAFDVDAWRRRCETLAGHEPGGGFARPRPPLFPGSGGRHRQRAFRDVLADVLPGGHGWLPKVRFDDLEFRQIERSNNAEQLLADHWDAKTGSSFG